MVPVIVATLAFGWLMRDSESEGTQADQLQELGMNWQLNIFISFSVCFFIIIFVIVYIPSEGLRC